MTKPCGAGRRIPTVSLSGNTTTNVPKTDKRHVLESGSSLEGGALVVEAAFSRKLIHGLRVSLASGEARAPLCALRLAFQFLMSRLLRHEHADDPHVRQLRRPAPRPGALRAGSPPR